MTDLLGHCCQSPLQDNAERRVVQHGAAASLPLI
eukprot:CAMPEP_0178371910 /NCGR_PEP_ID=MMETSP0689_2-20121128/1072_1 /TAXON_ID=160604 /ORGANISM="Amphidinium massartii, Strain CS-259" /LENGTH=33 /DNA_ID= /DNA_START= /DNA_END= /DNA_ORIENTATION=